MQNRLKYILDVGSSCLRLLAVGSYGKEQRIVAEDKLLYDGYLYGEFLSPDKLRDDLSQILERMNVKMRKNISSLVVGVPTEFCICVCKRISRKYVNTHKVTEHDLINLYESNSSFGDSEEYSVINYSPMRFVLDDEIETLSPVGMKTRSLVLDASYILAKRYFLTKMEECLHSLGVKHLEFISTALGQAMNCVPIKNDGKPIVIVDCGHISTGVAVYKGEGLALLSSFSMGGGHISSDIMQILGLNFRDSELIKRKVILTIESDKNEYYEVCTKGNLIKAPINMTNQIVKSRIETIAKVIANILSIDQVFKDIDIYLTGDGIANFKGAKNIIHDITGLNVYEYKIPFDNSKEKFQTSKMGLASLANIVI